MAHVYTSSIKPIKFGKYDIDAKCGGHIVSGIYLAITCEIHIAVGCVLYMYAKIFGPYGLLV